ncbi:GTP-binding protein [Allohahella marinimesophila]|uniref:GTP-binding protein n=1 Tax=Allohahella marinimesophila TaxID=1054972 RepID=A0ABP7NSR5_9GAMM
MTGLRAIPTNVVTGFLGVGKTTAILHLLKHRPEGERWAVLVNEFGQVGIDGGLFQSATGSGSTDEIFIREVPGGCMCCTNGLPMQVALNQLIQKARPDRLLIEPTGLGHPAEILEVITGPHYRDVLSLRAVITLVDARTIHDARYTGNATFNQQIEVADMVVASKADLAGLDDVTALQHYLDEKVEGAGTVHMISQGQLELAWLDRPHRESGQGGSTSGSHQHTSPEVIGSSQPVPAGTDYVRYDNARDGYRSLGWIFGPETVFDQDALLVLLSGLDHVRFKGVFITEEGIFAYNFAGDGLSRFALDEAMDSRMELICEADTTGLDDLESQLLACRMSDGDQERVFR